MGVRVMERPSDDADAAEIARFLEEDFWDQVADEVTGENEGSEGADS